jgi:uncharacterized protein (TIGR02145 family)
MKNILGILITTLIVSNIFLAQLTIAQAPQKMSYQAVIRNNSDQLVTNHAVGMRISILKDATPVYIETQTPTSNANGLVSIEIGAGTIVTGTFAGIDWSTGTYFLKTETDPAGGTSYSITGTSQLLSVPYAFYANNINLSINNRPSEMFVNVIDGTLMALPKISVAKPYSLLPSVTDADGNTYSTVKIGTQVWMGENLKTTKYNDNSLIPFVTDNSAWMALTTSAYCWYNNDITNKDVYGALYNSYGVNTNKLCPSGWHVPIEAEFNTLLTYLGSLASERMRESGTTQWVSNNANATNDSKFTALPAGGRNDFHNIEVVTFEGSGNWCKYWSSTLSDGNNLFLNIYTPMYEEVIYKQFNIASDYQPHGGYSIRCIRD